MFTPAQIDTALNVVSILEMVKDATKLKEALAKIKEAQDAGVAQQKKLDKTLADIAKGQKALAEQEAALAAEREKLRSDAAALAKNTELLQADAAAMREERNKFDSWMAVEREKLAAETAKVASDADQNVRRAEELKKEAAGIEKMRAKLDKAQEAVDAVRAEYEQKMVALKAMVAG